eukprot:scpid82040/ scgid27056/ 
MRECNMTTTDYCECQCQSVHSPLRGPGMSSEATASFHCLLAQSLVQVREVGSKVGTLYMFQELHAFAIVGHQGVVLKLFFCVGTTPCWTPFLQRQCRACTQQATSVNNYYYYSLHCSFGGVYVCGQERL